MGLATCTLRGLRVSSLRRALIQGFRVLGFEMFLVLRFRVVQGGIGDCCGCEPRGAACRPAGRAMGPPKP